MDCLKTKQDLGVEYFAIVQKSEKIIALSNI